MVTRARWPVPFALAALAACSPPPPSVLLTLEAPAGTPVRQARITPTTGGEPMRSQVLPPTPGEPFSARETVRLNFEASLSGRPMTLLVEGLSGAVVATGRGEVTLAAGEQALTIRLAACACPGGQECTVDGCRCGGKVCEADQSCEASECRCTPGSCRDGCCGDDERCHPGTEPGFCGLAGQACADCQGQPCAAGKCTACDCPDGCCVGPVCVTPLGAASCAKLGEACRDCTRAAGDGCSAEGACTCGGKGECEPGTRCLSGDCVCDATSCPNGCCQGGACLSPPSAAACGTAGAACADCTLGGAADTCGAGGQCRCGSGAPCGLGTRCDGGQCVCDATSCPDGCCQGLTCVRPMSLSECGAAGEVCQDCRVRADSCSPSAGCGCGSGPACAPGQRCTGSTCVCDEVSCPTGCCAGGTCVTTPTLAQCGTLGATCQPCAGTADRCTAGVCSCGSGAQCKAGTVCQDQACQCDALNCSGCCEATGCVQPANVDHCGAGGEACQACGFGSDQCLASGECSCNGAAPCGAGLHCTAGGACVCDTTSCPTGCCTAGGCQSASAACDPVRANGCTNGACSCNAGAVCADGQHCTAAGCVCDATSCPDGCCLGKSCTARGVHACAAAGEQCQDCGDLGDGCSAQGECTCAGGSGCVAGQVCSGSGCVCNASSCPVGCCLGNTCVEDGTTLAACGQNGAQCEVCDGATATLCLNGACRCGAYPACTPGAACVSNNCKCDATTCTAGCCDGKACVSPRTGAKCGPNGGACVDCGITADTCSATGECRCGSNPPCGTGLRCQGGACICDAQSNCAGCCDGNACVDGTSPTACGISSAVCTNCQPLGDSCPAHTCKCGSVGPCPTGKTCNSGVCQ